MSIAVIDTETTGLDPATASVVEFAVVRLPSLKYYTSIIKPKHEIEIKAMAAHHITEEMASKGITLKEAIAAANVKDDKIICAHNAAFDSGFVKTKKPWICTYRCARHIWPDAPSYSNQVLRYWLKIEEVIFDGDGPKIMKLPPHRALPDAWVTAHILNKMMETLTPERLIELTSKPILMKNVGFGEHRGKEWKDVPHSYMSWILRKDFDSDTVYTVKHHLGLLQGT